MSRFGRTGVFAHLPGRLLSPLRVFDDRCALRWRRRYRSGKSGGGQKDVPTLKKIPRTQKWREENSTSRRPKNQQIHKPKTQLKFPERGHSDEEQHKSGKTNPAQTNRLHRICNKIIREKWRGGDDGWQNFKTYQKWLALYAERWYNGNTANRSAAWKEFYMNRNNRQPAKITALYADVIIGINPGSLENTGVLPI